jgi:hypothetical protein
MLLISIIPSEWELMGVDIIMNERIHSEDGRR